MAMEVIVQRGEWKYCRVTNTTPAWVGWVHNSASAWMRAVGRILREARAAGIEADSTHTLWNAQYRYTRELTAAIGQLARAIDMPIPSFEPWAARQWALDAGPLPWWGWQLTGNGAWRAEVMRWAAREEHVADAANVQLELHYRVGLSPDGTLVTPLGENEGAPQTSRGEDWNSRLCPTGVFGAPRAITEQTWWACIPLSVWWPGAGRADRDVYVSASVPLAWHWQMAAEVAERIISLGTLEELIAACRQWTALKNLKAVKSLRRATPPVVLNVPEELLNVVRDDTLLHISGTADQQAFVHGLEAVGAAVINFPPVGTIIGVILEGLAAVLRAFGWAVGMWVDVWGRREPVMEVPRLTGKVTTSEGSEPEHLPETPDDRDRHTAPGFALLAPVGPAVLSAARRPRVPVLASLDGAATFYGGPATPAPLAVNDAAQDVSRGGSLAAKAAAVAVVGATVVGVALWARSRSRKRNGRRRAAARRRIGR